MRRDDQSKREYPHLNLVFQERDLQRVVDDVLGCEESGELDSLCASLTKYQLRQVVTRLVKQAEPLSALEVLKRAPLMTSRLCYLKLLALIDVKRYAEAEAEASRLLQGDPDNFVIREKRLLCRKELGWLTEALDDELFLLSKVKGNKKRIHQAYILRGWQRVKEGDLEKAEADLRLAEGAYPTTPDSLRLKGEIAYAYGDYLDAVDWLTRALQAFDPSPPRLSAMQRQRSYSQRSYAFQKLGRYELALQDLDQALTLGTSDSLTAWTYWQRAVLLKRMDRTADALSDVKAGLALSPRNFHLQALREDLGGERGPSDPPPATEGWPCLFSRALYHLKRGEWEEALQDMEASVGEEGDSIELSYWRALLLEKQGEYERAERLLATLAGPALKDGKLMLWAAIKEPEWKERLNLLWHR